MTFVICVQFLKQIFVDLICFIGIQVSKIGPSWDSFTLVIYVFVSSNHV